MALVIIDMQNQYKPASDNCADEVVLAIRKARKNREQIFNITFGNSPVVTPVLAELKKCTGVINIEKSGDDGSGALTTILRRKGWLRKFKHFKICGVHTDACVLNTVLGMTSFEHFKRIMVIKHACAAADSVSRHLTGLKKMSQYKKVKIV